MPKRILELLLVLIAAPVWAPLMILVGLTTRIALGSPVIFRQKRPGLHGVVFDLYKFRTMTDARNDAGERLSDRQRLTRYGRFLRSTSLDELPSLFNVLRGDLALVGPRPLLVEYLERYSPEQARRHDVKPGMTGWAQVRGRNSLSWEDKFALDLWYVEHRSLALDVRILMLTVLKVIVRDGISPADEATMPEFMGSAGREG